MKSDPTNAGTFDGTWIYVNRDSRFAMWIRTKQGKRQLRLQYQSLASPEAFETDWDGKAIYYMGDKPVNFELKLTTQTADELSGTWSWVLKFGTSGRVETADVFALSHDVRAHDADGFQELREDAHPQRCRSHGERPDVVGVDQGQQARDSLAGDAVLTRGLERGIFAVAVIALFLSVFTPGGRTAEPARRFPCAW
jgi:hypothetical protein